MAASPPPGPPRPRPQPPPEVGKNFKPRSFEDQVRLAYFSPSPHQYSPKQPGNKSNQVLGKISESRIPSALDHVAREKSLVPGPGSYETPDMREMALPEG